jgi:ABC-type nickel/cobalt efflux system permease component RcnA
MRQFLRNALRAGFMVLAVMGMLVLAAAAQTEPRKPPFGLAPAPVTTAQPATWWGQALAAQQKFLRDMGQSIRGLKSADPYTAAATLAGLSFLYGVLHAAGPGHGKAVISSYVLANRETARRGIALSFLAAFFQACSAIAFVAVLALLLKSTSFQMKAAESWIETASWVMVAGIGVWLLWRQVRPLFASRTVAASEHASHGHAHAHGHSHTHGHAPHVHADGSVCTHDHGHDHGQTPAVAASTRAAATAPAAAVHRHADGSVCTHDHGHKHGSEADHVHGPDCGHAHMPDPKDLQGPWSWRRALAISFGIGMRPCSGAILLMLFALGQGLLWAGVVATFMMSLGTAITVSVLAVLAITSRDAAIRLTGADSRWGQRIATGVGIAGAILVIGIGVAGLAYPTPEPMFTTR